MKRRPASGTALAEFAPALFVFLLITLFPFINLMGLAWSCGTAAFLGVQLAGAASQSASLPDALNVMQTQSNTFLTSGFGRFANLTPVGGWNNCGADLFVNATAYPAGTVTTYGPNTGPPPPIDQTKNIYEYSVRTTYDIMPCVRLGAVPFIGSIPGVGAPVRLSWLTHRAVENPESLVTANATSANPGGKPLP